MEDNGCATYFYREHDCGICEECVADGVSASCVADYDRNDKKCSDDDWITGSDICVDGVCIGEIPLCPVDSWDDDDARWDNVCNKLTFLKVKFSKLPC